MLKVPDGLRSVTTIQEFSSRTIRVRMAPMGKSGLNMNNRISDEKLIEKVKQGEAAAVQEMCRRYRLLIKKLISARTIWSSICGWCFWKGCRTSARKRHDFPL